MTESATDALARYGISIDFDNAGFVVLTGKRGVTCTYSARSFCPVVGFGADGVAHVALRPDGVARLVIEGRPYEYRKNDPDRNLDIPHE